MREICPDQGASTYLAGTALMLSQSMAVITEAGLLLQLQLWNPVLDRLGMACPHRQLVDTVDQGLMT